MAGPKLSEISPGRILLASFLFVISLGTFFLSLPISRVVQIPFIDILFTSVSSTCVTGLQVVPMTYFSFFGKCVILTLIQIGGLGLMTLSFFLISLILNLRLITKLIAGQILEFESSDKIKTFLAIIIGTTFFAELIGAITLYIPFSKLFGFKKAVFYSIFHSISAFCNSGITLFENSITPQRLEPITLMTISTLILLGGIGFIVWYELANKFKKFLQSRKNKEYKKNTLSLHTKMVLTANAGLLIAGSVLFLILENENTLKNLGWIDKFINSIFMSVVTRTAGFSSINIAQLTLPTLLIIIVLMFIGASPSSTGGGIKVTTFTLFIASIATIVKGKSSIELYGRRIPDDQIYKTTVIVALGLIWIGLTTFILLITEKDFTFIQIVFESVSAFATAGLSTGITPFLTSTGKSIMMISMLVGRIGSLTLVLALRRKTEPQRYSYPEERVIIG